MVRHPLDGAIFAVEDPEHAGPVEDAAIGSGPKFGLGCRDPVSRWSTLDRSTFREKAAAQAEILLAQRDAGASPHRGQRRHEPGRAGTDDEHVAVKRGLVVVIGIMQAGGSTEPGGTADQRLVELFPEGCRPHEGLVIKAGRQDRCHQLVHAHRVEAKRGPAVLARGHEPGEQLGHRGARVRLASCPGAEFDDGVRFLGAGRQDAARAMILERSPDEPHAVGEKRRGERVAGMAAERRPVEGEIERRAPVHEPARREPERLGCRGAAAAPNDRSIFAAKRRIGRHQCASVVRAIAMSRASRAAKTPWVRTSRSTTSQAWHPEK